jgi:hypothetical protein
VFINVNQYLLSALNIIIDRYFSTSTMAPLVTKVVIILYRCSLKCLPFLSHFHQTLIFLTDFNQKIRFTKKTVQWEPSFIMLAGRQMCGRT